MRSLSAFVVMLSGCVFGDDLTGPAPEPGSNAEPPGVLQDPGARPPALRPVPAECGVFVWPAVQRTDKGHDLAIVPNADGATILTAPLAGGAVRGFRIDARGALVGADATLRADASYTAVAASWLDDRLVIASTAGDKVTLDIADDDLTALHPLGQVAGTLVGDAPILSVRESRLAVTGGGGGVLASSFDGADWVAGPTQTVTKAAVTSLTATAFHSDAIVAWSATDGTCHLQRLASGQESVRDFRCDAARIAIDPDTYRGTLVYEEDGDVMLTHVRIGAESELADHLRLREAASAPRVVFDGTRTWISFLDFRGDVTVGYLDADGNLVARGLAGVRPDPDSYDLAAFGDAVWLVFEHDLGFGGLRMCLRSTTFVNELADL